VAPAAEGFVMVNLRQLSLPSALHAFECPEQQLVSSTYQSSGVRVYEDSEVAGFKEYLWAEDRLVCEKGFNVRSRTQGSDAFMAVSDRAGGTPPNCTCLGVQC